MEDKEEKQQEGRDLFAPDSDHFGSQKKEKKKSSGFLSFFKRKKDSERSVAVTNPWDNAPVSDSWHKTLPGTAEEEPLDSAVPNTDARMSPGFWNSPMTGPADEAEYIAAGTGEDGDKSSYKEPLDMSDQEMLPSDGIPPSFGGGEDDTADPESVSVVREESLETPLQDEAEISPTEERLLADESESPVADFGIDLTKPDDDTLDRPVPSISDLDDKRVPDTSAYPVEAVSSHEQSVLPFETKDPVSAAPPKDQVPERRSLLSVFRKKEADLVVPEYNFETADPLVSPSLAENEEEVDSYWIEKGFSLVLITYNRVTRLKEYHLFEPVLTRFEYELLERLYEDLRDILILTDSEIREKPELLLFRKAEALISQYGLNLAPETMYKLRYYLKRNFLGWSRIDPLMKDLEIEDISCDGHGIPLFLYHRQHRNIRTNIQFPEQQLNSLAISLAQRSGKHISIGNPILDATLPDGSRLQLTLGTEVTSRGSSFTIRKFRPEPFTPIELMEKGTFNVDQLVYFWLAIENNKSLIFIGGTASGKTSSLNAMSLFIPPLAKVVSIEDTREIMLYRENWIASVTRESLTAEGSRSISMFDLLKAGMRQRPEYIIVGEVRGPEAQTLFQAMNTGHTTYSTMHAGGVDATIHRLESEPLNVPRNMLQALNIISFQSMIFRGSERVRRCQEVVEITGIEPNSGNILVNNVFEYDPISDEMRYSGRSHVYSAIAANRGWSREELQAEVGKRRQVILALHEQDIRDFKSVSEIFSIFAITPDVIFEHIDDLSQVLS
ncbi:type II/IV secretion system ATPase subunit [Methanocalculus taiwanensis]